MVEGFGEAVGGEELEDDVGCGLEIGEVAGGDVEGFVSLGDGEGDAEKFSAVDNV